MRLPLVLTPTPDWGTLSAAQLKPCYRAATRLVNSMQDLAERDSQVVQAIIAKQDFIEWQHYPENDVRDKQHASQYFYHAHPGLQRPFTEHGHFHLFVHAEELGMRRAHPRYSAAPAHLLAISMNALGVPSGFFLVNRWVTKGAWLNYTDCVSGLEQFQIKTRQSNPQLKQINQFLQALITLYRAPILALLQQRDQIMQKLSATRDRRSVFADRSIEVLCYHPITLMDDIAALELALEQSSEKK
ncbi:MAG: hypothetical protein NTY70_11055 [Burkholderiales bacterium]|nr:hypothetical protein [Burkholderiales bacterium]